MHEFLLFGQVLRDDHNRVRQQLCGVTRMQPQPVSELHLVFKARAPPGLKNIPSSGGSQNVVAVEVQKTRALLNASLFYLQLVGEPSIPSAASGMAHFETASRLDPDDMIVEQGKRASGRPGLRWRLEFRDIPDAGKQAVSMRLMSRTPVENGDAFRFLQDFGYEYVSRYVVIGDRFYDQDLTLSLQKVMQLSSGEASDPTTDVSNMPPIESLSPLDTCGSFVLQASVETVDGNNPELKDRATRQLLSMKEILKHGVLLNPGDRLSLDTRVPLASGQS